MTKEKLYNYTNDEVESARQQAMEWLNNSDACKSLSDLYNDTVYFTSLGLKYGLLDEFAENGIPVSTVKDGLEDGFLPDGNYVYRFEEHTVKEFIEHLSELPEKYLNYKLSICGLTNFFIHLRDYEECVTLDTEWCID